MEFESIRPILSGIAGGIIATWLTSRWARQLPSHYGHKPREFLLQQHKLAVRTANVLFVLGLFFGVGLYRMGDFPETDWRPAGIGFGVASLAPLIALIGISLLTGRSVREALVAFAWGQGTPIAITYGILGAGVVTFVWALASLAA